MKQVAELVKRLYEQHKHQVKDRFQLLTSNPMSSAVTAVAVAHYLSTRREEEQASIKEARKLQVSYNSNYNQYLQVEQQWTDEKKESYRSED